MRYELQEKPVTTQHEKLGKIEFLVEVPQASSQEEAVTMCGGTDALIAFVNSQIATNAKNVARAKARGFEVPKDVVLTEEVIAKFIAQITEEGQALAKTYTPAADTERGPSKAKKAAAYDQLAALVNSGQEFTKEQLLQMLDLAK